jgi:hypothetical protein
MKHLLVAAPMLLAATFGGTALAELPFPLPGQPGPDLGRRPPCTDPYRDSLERQLAVLQGLRRTGPEAMHRVCTLIELGSAFLGLDADLARIARQCRIGQGDLERDPVSRLGYLRSELVRCNDTI